MKRRDPLKEYLQGFVYDKDLFPGNVKVNELPKQNVIWIIADQLRAQAFSHAYDPNIITPNIDNLAQNGVIFDNAVSSFPICCPFRATLLSGMDHQQCMPGHQYRMPEGFLTIADVFNEQGYDTAYFGKWHLDGDRKNPMMHIVPKNRRGGFKTWIGYENNNMQWNTYVHGHTPQEEIEQHRLLGYETDELTNLLINYLDKKTVFRRSFCTTASCTAFIPCI